MELGTLRELATLHGVTYSRARTWATEPWFPRPVDTTRRPYLYDLDAVAAAVAARPGQGARTDLAGSRSTPP